AAEVDEPRVVLHVTDAVAAEVAQPELAPPLRGGGEIPPRAPGTKRAAAVPPGHPGREEVVVDAIAVEVTDAHAPLVHAVDAGQIPAQKQPGFGLRHGIVKIVMGKHVGDDERAIGTDLWRPPQFNRVSLRVDKGVVAHLHVMPGGPAVKDGITEGPTQTAIVL